MKSSIPFLLLAILATPVFTLAQQPPAPPPPSTDTAAPTPQPAPPPPPPATTTAPAPAPAAVAPATDDQAPSVLSRAASSAYDRRDAFPSVNIYLPEGQASIRLRKLIKNVLFESQIDYKFVEGDISTYLRYKYYARNFTYKIGVFDTIGFPNIGQKGVEFERVRGGLLLVELPRDYNNRYFWLVQDDRLTFGEENIDNRKNNIYTKLGFQYGTQFDERMNAIVGESRGRIVPVLTAFRDIGPQKLGLAGAITQSARISTGDYKYTKLEAEALRRFDITGTSFIFSRLHAGTFLSKGTNPNAGTDPLPDIERYTIPRYELFRLGGREALKSIGADDSAAGTNEIHLTNEYFVPIFRNRDFRTWLMRWNTLYGIGYVGAGTATFNTRDLTKSENFVFDAGIGTEASLRIRDFDVLFSVIYAHTFHAPGDMRGDKVRFSIRTIR
jgi:hypothetical protein